MWRLRPHLLPSALPGPRIPSPRQLRSNLLPHSAASKRNLLPHNYVPSRPRNAFIILRDQVYMEAKKLSVTRSKASISKEAGERWRALSGAEQGHYEMLAEAEKDLWKKRFPRARKSEKPGPAKYALKWSVETDHLFVIDAQGAIQYASPAAAEEDVGGLLSQLSLFDGL
ncbi:hypothetical protein BDZ89DRAFT_1144104 [Hymenopellis radicata]|nr:hypothetical protein BDZ89DRAFT_1144104 [Hymenopellis radicata]